MLAVPIAVFLAVIVYISYDSTRRLEKARKLYITEQGLICTQCRHAVDPKADRGVCEHCGTLWEHTMLAYAWRSRFNDLADHEKPHA